MSGLSSDVGMKKSHRNGLIAVAALEIFFGACAIGCSIATIVLTYEFYWDCYYYNWNYDASYGDFYYDCRLYYYTFRMSVTAQGIWAGCMVIISASINIRFAKQPKKAMGSVSGGFSIFSFILILAMLIVECFPVVEGSFRYYSDYYWEIANTIWILHCALLSFAGALFVLTMTNMILSYMVTGCCGTSCCACCGDQVEYPQPSTVGNVYYVPNQQQHATQSGQAGPIVFQGGYIGPQIAGQILPPSPQQQVGALPVQQVGVMQSQQPVGIVPISQQYGQTASNPVPQQSAVQQTAPLSQHSTMQSIALSSLNQKRGNADVEERQSSITLVTMPDVEVDEL